MAYELDHFENYDIDAAATLMRRFLIDKDADIAAAWPKKKLKAFIVAGLKAAGQNQTYISKKNMLHLQYCFSPMFRELDKEHPRMSQVAQEIVPVDNQANASALLLGELVSDDNKSARVTCACAKPCSADFRIQPWNATESFPTPQPDLYKQPRSYWAGASPASALIFVSSNSFRSASVD